ncbi:hypothetical protein [Ferrovibrio terrae]|jgi:hypothetical protein|uniref:hypothetical protein n=1 Tax=Ferrovibrio terrae TaxID=2594003 RepID=UPI003137AAA8
MRKLIQAVLIPLLLVGSISACSDQRSDLTPFTQSTAVGVGYEIFKARVERRLEMTCNLENVIVDGKYCVSNFKPTDRQEVFCFKTLGGVDCYAEPDPYSLEGRQLPAPPRALADPRMPMTPPGRRPQPQLPTAPYDQRVEEIPPEAMLVNEPAPDPAIKPM